MPLMEIIFWIFSVIVKSCRSRWIRGVSVGRDGTGGTRSGVGRRKNANQTDPEVRRRRVMRDAILWFPFPSSAVAAASGYLSIYPPFSPIFRRGEDTNEEERGGEREREGEREEVSGGVDRYPRSRCGGKRQEEEEAEAGWQANKWPETFFVFSSLLSRLQGMLKS